MIVCKRAVVIIVISRNSLIYLSTVDQLHCWIDVKLYFNSKINYSVADTTLTSPPPGVTPADFQNASAFSKDEPMDKVDKDRTPPKLQKIDHGAWRQIKHDKNILV